MYGCSWSRMSSSFLYSVLKQKPGSSLRGRHFSRCKGSEWSKMRLELLNDRQAKTLTPDSSADYGEALEAYRAVPLKPVD